MKYNERQVNIVTIKSPLPGRYKRFLYSIGKIAQVKIIIGTIVPTDHLGMNMNTLLAYMMLFCKSLNKLPSITDVIASVYGIMKRKSDLVIDFRTPYPVELAWFGHKNLALIASRMEKIIKDQQLVFTVNDRMASLCKELGAISVHVIPNYPTRKFKPTMAPDKWKTIHGIEGQIVLFTGNEWLREIYGLDLLLESWKLVEQSMDANLIILGNTLIDYIHRMMQSYDIKHLILPGWIGLQDVANWVNCADVCVAPRTKGFPKRFYDDKDSTKISEYAALKKPIVAAGYAPSSQYLLVDQTPEAFAEGIMKGLDGNINLPVPHYWEENESTMLKLLESFWFG